MAFTKPNKAQRNEAFLQLMGGINNEPYAEEILEQKKLFLIVCEGENTEPCYFEGFPVPTNTVITERGCNSKTTLVDYAIKISKEEKYQDREVWCVFDMDTHSGQAATEAADFNSAIVKAEAHGLKVAWSNDAFELWFVLHYQNLATSLTRQELYDILKRRWGLQSFSSEAKVRTFCEGHYERHLQEGASQEQAIRFAEALHTNYGGARNFASQCPCTTVYMLVKELNNNRK